MGESVDRCRKLEREYQWIPSERPHFGRPGSDYDWAVHDPEKASRGGVSLLQLLLAGACGRPSAVDGARSQPA